MMNLTMEQLVEIHGPVWTHPDILDLLIRQHKDRVEFSAKQSQRFVQVAAMIRRELKRREVEGG